MRASSYSTAVVRRASFRSRGSRTGLVSGGAEVSFHGGRFPSLQPRVLSSSKLKTRGPKSSVEHCFSGSGLSVWPASLLIA